MLEHQRSAHKVGHANVSPTIKGCLHGCPYTSTAAIAAEEHNKKAHTPCGYMGCKDIIVEGFGSQSMYRGPHMKEVHGLPDAEWKAWQRGDMGGEAAHNNW